jgi:transposase
MPRGLSRTEGGSRNVPEARLKRASRTADEEHVRLLRRSRDDEPVDMNERSPQLGVKYKDLAVLDQLMKSGADLTKPRHVLYYSYAPTEDVAQAIGREAETNGFAASVREPLPDFPGQWSVT